jgi:predicted S18 family serine protease
VKFIARVCAVSLILAVGLPLVAMLTVGAVLLLSGLAMLLGAAVGGLVLAGALISIVDGLKESVMAAEKAVRTKMAGSAPENVHPFPGKPAA